mgnify:FL=1
MSLRDNHAMLTVRFYATAPYACSYLPDRQARSQVAMPAESIDAGVYSQLVRIGFRRSGLFTYRPYCDACQACISVRVPVAEFTPGRSQQRAWRRHCGLSVRLLPLEFDEEHYRLYRRYQLSRHKGGSMEDDSRQQYSEFILKSGVESWLAEFRDGNRLCMVSLIDRLEDGVSAVYTFYDPDEPRASFGTYNVLWQIRLARQLGLPYLYLGYWIADCRKMAYKTNFRPLERLVHGVWRRQDDPSASP